MAFRLRTRGDGLQGNGQVPLGPNRFVAAYAIGTTSGMLVNLENCSGCGVSGWGWQNRAYWLTQAARYLITAPGPVKNDNTIVAN